MNIRQAADNANAKIIEAINRIKNTQIGYALARARQRFSQAVGGLGAGETISINGQMPPSVIESLAKVGIDVSALEQLSERWNIVAEMPDIAWDAILNNDGVMQQVRSNLPRTDPPKVIAWNSDYLRFRANISEPYLGKHAIKDEPLALMHREIGALVAWVAEVQANNVLNIVNGNLTYARNELNNRVGQTMMMLRRMLGEIRTYIIAPRDEMIRQIATAIQAAYGLLQESIALNEGAIQELNGILQEIQRTGQEVGASGTTVAEILDGVRRRNAERREIIDRKLTELESAVRTIAQAIGVGV